MSFTNNEIEEFWNKRAKAYNDMLDQKHPYMEVVAKHLDLSDDDPEYSCRTTTEGQSRTQDINALILLFREARWNFDGHRGQRLSRQRYLTEYHATLGRTLENVRR